MKILDFKWCENRPTFQLADITIREGWWIFSTDTVYKVVRLKKCFSDELGNWWLLKTGQDIDIPEYFYEDSCE